MTNVMQQNFMGNDPVTQTSHNNTTRYKQIESTEIISFLKAHGFELVSTSYASPGDIEKQGYQKHLMMFEHPDMLIDEDNRLQLLASNSHDGKSSFKLDLGIFRAICANGLVTGDSFFSERIRHVGETFYTDLFKALERVLVAAPKVTEAVARLKGIELTDRQITALTQNIVSERLSFLKDKPNDGIMVDLQDVITPQRRGDWSNDAYTVLNRLQEKVIRGGIKYQVKKFVSLGETYVWEYKKNTTREVKAQDAKLKLNKMVFDNVIEFCKEA